MSDGAPSAPDTRADTSAPDTTGPTSTPSDRDLESWIADRRWYASKGSVPRLRTISTDDGTRLVLDEAPAVPVLYQSPITSDPDGVIVDATTDLAWVSALAARIDGAPDSLSPIGRVTAARVLTGEQSNTSVICDTESGDRVIIKVFRVLHHGDNPDVTTQLALTAAGSTRVPRVYGALRADWPDVGRPDGTATGHLAFAQEFLPGLDDAWRVALQEAQAGTPFGDRAEQLGTALADVHSTLAGALPTEPADAPRRDAAVATMHARLDTAAREAPAVAGHVDAIRAVYARAADATWPDLQRIHGDLHLGQVLSAPDPRGWVFLDFEGEPLRPLDERSLPDVTLRDVAGMLRSFDYVAGALAHDAEPVDAASWAAEARARFLEGYQRGTGADLAVHSALLDAFELDKAVYEVVYETRNRPDWVGIPLAAVARLVGDSGS
ncbi:phosphotransferase [Curtobacterium flaccumfaciens]|uniref:phosphotransferase n=1 Tax=Curtobacterium flaccumfaciens TaxID=2035 RepID=UPI0020326556|nr:phosphotransferase [Curtobacterium flaccumfaciens]MCS0470657.1 phosphotransferase [Curtobacterium flaccumfaciens pv. betae]MCS0473661.1 phosphotransferase [Curtobacterium flaccumfaciens pv. betae]MCS0477069.1 phosphotransferase [Curtobacterium flaccumfaciens pv. betae]MCS0482677.1 phosphotransferase [Curtobacterium flaccumfaciens pv. betae]MCS0484743.1 phosphotransferase [Curtobacterium flaccumfaciens pv. betae]